MPRFIIVMMAAIALGCGESTQQSTTQQPRSLTKVVLSPDSVTLAPAGTSLFSVSGTWSDASAATPNVSYSATGGTITADGLYTAGTTVGHYLVIAQQQGGALADTSAVAITTAPLPTLTTLVLSPDTVTLAAAATRQFSVSGTWSNGSAATPAVTYSATVVSEVVSHRHRPGACRAGRAGGKNAGLSARGALRHDRVALDYWDSPGGSSRGAVPDSRQAAVGR